MSEQIYAQPQSIEATVNEQRNSFEKENPESAHQINQDIKESINQQTPMKQTKIEAHSENHTIKEQAMLEDEHRSDELNGSQSNTYKDLTNKLEKALKKISSSKKQFKTEQKLNLYSRFQECQLKKTKVIQLKKQQLYEKQIKEVKSKPDINKKSEKIAHQVGYVPIYKRYQKIVENKKKKFEEIEQNKKKIESQQINQFFEEFEKHKKIPANPRSHTEYYEQMVRWNEKIQKECKEKANQNKIKELEQATFKPKLNPKSEKMIKSATRIPIYEREVVKKKVEPEFSFTPKINKRKPII